MKTHEKIIIGAYSIVLTVSVILGSIWWYKYTSAKRRLDELGRLSEQYREQLTGAESAFESAKEEKQTEKKKNLEDSFIKNYSPPIIVGDFYYYIVFWILLNLCLFHNFYKNFVAPFNRIVVIVK